MTLPTPDTKTTVNTPVDQWLTYVELFRRAYDLGRRIDPVEEVRHPLPVQPATEEGAGVLVCSPHPDDEALTGGLALRLAAGGATVLNLAVTLGNRQERKKARLDELSAACRVLGFACRTVCEPMAFSQLSPDDHLQKNDVWEKQVETLTNHLDREQPQLVLLPHVLDNHPTHIAVHHLAMTAVARHSSRNDRKLLIAETEFWHPMAAPNLLLGLRPEEVATLVAATFCHRGEVARHPYHLRLPARMMDNVRRFDEGGRYGSQAINLLFGEPYRLSLADRGQLQPAISRPTVIRPESPLSLADLQSLCDTP